MNMYSISISFCSSSVQKNDTFFLVDFTMPSGISAITIDLAAPEGYKFVTGVYNDQNPQSNVTLEVANADGIGAVVRRAGKYRLGGVARFSIALMTIALAVPEQMAQPALAGGVQNVTLTLAAPPFDGGAAIASYGYELVTESDTAFATPIASGSVAAADREKPITVTPLQPGNYIARSRAVNAIGDGAWSVAAAATTVAAAATTVATPATAPAQMSAPSLVGGEAEATLTLAAAPGDGGSAITSYGYQIDTAAGDFSAPIAQGTTADRATPISASPLVAGDYKARSRAVNAIGSGAWSLASSNATVTAAG